MLAQPVFRSHRLLREVFSSPGMFTGADVARNSAFAGKVRSRLTLRLCQISAALFCLKALGREPYVQNLGSEWHPLHNTTYVIGRLGTRQLNASALEEGPSCEHT